MGPRPEDFDEEVIRQSPTFVRWLQLKPGEKLRYACREFIRGHGDDEERLMRRVMIARRNNIRDHEVLKKARRVTKSEVVTANEITRRRRSAPSSFSDHQVEKEMDVAAVMATRSYRAWDALPNGAEFTYNQRYVKGKDGHDWLLRKNIWRRMRYRRENKKLVQRLRHNDGPADQSAPESVASHIVDHALLPETGEKPQTENSGDAAEAAAAAAAAGEHLADQAAVEAAVAAAESFGKTAGLDVSVVHNPLEAAAQAALDAAAQLAAATTDQTMDELPEELMEDSVDV